MSDVAVDAHVVSLDGDADTGPMSVDLTIDCIDCGGRCHLLVTWAPDNPPIAGDVVTYRCADCLDVWYIEVPEDEPDA